MEQLRYVLRLHEVDCIFARALLTAYIPHQTLILKLSLLPSTKLVLGCLQKVVPKIILKPVPEAPRTFFSDIESTC